MSTNQGFEDVLKAVEHHHAQYMKHLRLFHEATAKNFSHPVSPMTPRDRIGNSPVPSPALRAVTFPSDSSHLPSPSFNKPRSRRLTNDGTPENGYLTHAQIQTAAAAVRPSSVYEGVATESGDDLDSEFLPLTPPSRAPTARTSSETYISYVSRPLRQESFSEQNLANHLASLEHTTVSALGEALWENRGDLTAGTIVDQFGLVEDAYANATYEVYEVGRDGRSEARHAAAGGGDHGNDSGGDQDGEALSAAVVWETLREVNREGESVGRMTILQEPSPLMLGAAHMTLKDHFDMDELFQHLVSTNGNKGKTRAYMSRAYETNPLRQRSFFFVFKYYTIVGDGLVPAPWQAYDSRPPDKKSPDHIDIAECSSVLALSLGGDPTRTVKNRVRRKAKEGKVFDTFAPWHLLNIQCFPDDEHSMRSEDFSKSFCNGPYAFLNSLSVEYRDAVKRYTNLNQSISKLITPPNQFMFDAKLRDKLLFEDKDFTYSRRYFWAYNTLGVINDGIKSMRSAYLDTFSKDFWAARHATLWPHPFPDSPEGREYLSRIQTPRAELDAAVRDLQDVYDKNSRTRDEIRSLREQLFSGSSVKESRRAIEQGDNIKILTSVSMIFLPLTFVTSVFGITTFNISERDWRFPVTMVSVCIPFFLLIVVLQTQAAMQALRKSIITFKNYMADSFRRITPSPASNTATEGRRRFRRRRRGGGREPVGLKRTQSGVQGQGLSNSGERVFWNRMRRLRPTLWGWKESKKEEIKGKDEIV